MLWQIEKNSINKLFVFTIILLMIPSIVNANIVCNDGTESPTCIDCHTGCCSGHKGCTDRSNNNYRKNSSIAQKKTNNGLSKIEYIFLLLFSIPWAIAILKTILDSIKDCLKKVINKIKNRKKE